MRHAPGRNGRRGGLLAALLLTLVVWGCDGNNLFGPGVGFGPQIITLEAPESVNSGEVLTIRVRAVGLVRVDSIVTTAKGGDFSLRQVSLSENQETDFTVTQSFDIPSPITDTLVVLTATAYDAQGNPSLPRLDTVRVFDTTPPTVQATIGGTTVGQGKSITFQVQASDNIGLVRIGYQLLNANGDVVVGDSVAASGRTAQHTFAFDVPLEFPLGTYQLRGFALDLDGNRSTQMAEGELEVIFIDEEVPVVTILQPSGNPNVAIGDTLRVVTRFTDNDGIDSVHIRGVAFRGDVNLGTFQEVARYQEWHISITNPPADTTLTRILQPTADSTQETARIIVTAWDKQGNHAADTTTVQLRGDVDPPTVSIFNPTEAQNVVIGDSVLVQASVADPNGFVRSGVTRVRFEGVAFRGNKALGTFAAVPRFTPKEVEISPAAVSSQTISRFLVPTADTTVENVHFIVTAFDGWGNTRADTVMVVMTPDGTIPAVRIIEPTEGSGSPTGDSILVRARLQSADGIEWATYDGVAHRGDRDLGTHVEVTRYTAKTVEFNPPVMDTVLARFLTATSDETSELVWIRAEVMDVNGNLQRDSVQITVGGPRVELPDLVSGQTIQAGTDVQIRIVASDPAGISDVFLEIAEPAGAPPAGPFGPFSISPAQTDVEIEVIWSVPAGASGAYVVMASARNTNGIVGTAAPLNLIASATGGVDTTPPSVRVIPTFFGSAFDPQRMELTDSIRVQVTGQDNAGGAGVIESGFTFRIVPRNRTDTLYFTDSQLRGVPASGTISAFFNFTVEDMVAAIPLIIDLLSTPDTLDLDVFGWMRDAAASSNCGATTSATTPMSLSCGPPFGPDGERIAAGETGMRRTVSIVSGRTVRLPSGGTIADAVIDTTDTRRRLYLSNIALSRLEVFDLTTSSFTSPVLVGAEPWGLAFDRGNNDQLLVANSGGTNLSFVNLNTLSEVADRRIFTPNALLFNVVESISEAGGVDFQVAPAFDFSDRPQFVAMDSVGRIVYSTRPTGAAPDGTIRIAERAPDPADRTQVTIFTDYALLPSSDAGFALANVTGMFGGPSARAETHAPFTPRTAPPVVLSSLSYAAAGGTVSAINELAAEVSALAPALPEIFLPRVRTGQLWEVDRVGLQDTTFIAASGTGNRVAIGEGATAETGRVILWDAVNLAPSGAVSVLDLVNNASERVMGLAMNHDGRLGAARGLFAAYFFDPDLRLQGTVALESGGAGIALHPLHTVNTDGTQPTGARLAFVPVGTGAIDIFDTFNFNRIGRVFVRDPIVGPVRASLPFPGENPAGCLAGAISAGGYSGPDYTAGIDDSCIVVKLVGATQGGGVVVIDVTKADVTRFLP